jgi:hypothetical protein
MYTLIGTVTFAVSAFLLFYPFASHVGHPDPVTFAALCAMCAGGLGLAMMIIEERAR